MAMVSTSSPAAPSITSVTDCGFGAHSRKCTPPPGKGSAPTGSFLAWFMRMVLSSLMFSIIAPSIRLVPRQAQTRRALDQADHAVGLRKVAPQFTGIGRDVLGQQTQMVASGQHVLEQLSRLVLLADVGQGQNPPQRADQERGLGPAEIVLLVVAQQEIATPQVALYRVHAGDQARVVGRQELQFGDEQQSGVEIVAAEGGRETAEFRIPGPRADFGVNARGALGPESGAVLLAESFGDRGQPVAGGPAHHAGKGVDALAAA